MKIAVVGGGSTYTPELVSGLSRERDRIDVRELVLHDIDAERREVVGGMARADARPPGLRRRARWSPATSTARVDGADFVLVQIRVGGQAARLSDETRPARLRLHRPGDDRRGRASRRRCAPCRSCSRSPSASRERAAADAWIVDFTNPVGIVTRALLDAGHRAVGLCNVAIGFQRAFARLLGVEPERVVVDQVGLNHLTWVRARPARRRGRAARSCSPSTATSSPTRSALPRRLLEELGAVPSYYLRYFYAHDAVLAEQLDGVPRAADGGRDRARAARALPRSRARREAGAARAARRRVLQRGRDRPRRVARRRRSATCTRSTCANDGTLAGLADDDVVEVPARVDARTDRRRCRRRRSRPSCSASSSTSPRTSGWPPRRRVTRRPGRRAQGAARASADRPVRAVDELVERLLRGRAAALASAEARVSGRSSSPSTAATRRPTSRSSRADGALLALARGPQSSPHHLGVDGCLDVLEELLDEAVREAGLARGDGAVAEVGELLLAGVDFPREEERARGRGRARAAGRRAHASATTLRRPARRHGARLGRRGRLRRRHQLRRRRARRPPGALPRARRDHRRLGRRLRRRARRRVGRGAQRGRPRPEDDARAARCRRTSASTTPPELAEAIHRGRIAAARA